MQGANLKENDSIADNRREKEDMRIKDIIAAVILAIPVYLIWIHCGIWCGIATFLILLIAYKEFAE